MIEVRTKFKSDEEMADISAWLRTNVGKGQERFRKNTWLGTDDWFCYTDYQEPTEGITEDDLVFDDDESECDTVFVFRREEDASLFGLKWI